MTGWAARYSLDVNEDFARGFSFQGWAITPAATEDEIRNDLVDQYGWSKASAANARIEWADLKQTVHLDNTRPGFLPAHDGICAWFCDDWDTDEENRDDVIERARADGRFGDIPLYVFRAEWISRDAEDGTDIVRPIGEAEEVN